MQMHSRLLSLRVRKLFEEQVKQLVINGPSHYKHVK